jgi:hypothetical protein
MEGNEEVFNSALAMASVDGDQEFLGELAGITEAAWPTLRSDIREALAGGDLQGAQKGAHLVRVMVQNLFARRAYLAAFLLETMAGVGELEGARQAIGCLEKEMDRLKPIFADLGKNVGRLWSLPGQISRP